MTLMVLKTCPYLRMRQTKSYTVFKAQTRKMTPYSRKQQQKNSKNLTTTQSFIKSLSFCLTGYFRFNRWFVSHLSGRYRIWIFVDIITVAIWSYHAVYENHICQLRSEELYEWGSSQLYTQLLQLRKESLKEVQDCTDSNPWPLRYRCSDNLHFYDSSLRSSHIWFSYNYNFIIILYGFITNQFNDLLQVGLLA